MAAATEALDGYEPFPAATAIAELVDDASNWYVRRSRRRFWRTDPDADPADSLGAQATLHEVLVTVARLLAPLCPFLADRMWRDLTDAAERDSVHLADWPALGAEAIDPDARGGDGPGPPALLARPGGPGGGGDQGAPATGPGPGLPASGQPDAAAGGGRGRAQRGRGGGHRRAGRRARLRAGAQLQAAGTPARVPRSSSSGRPWARWTARPRPPALAAGRPVVVELADGPVELGGDEVELRVRAQPGFAVSRDGAEVVALDLALDDDLRRRGLAREVIRNVQELRKAAGLEVSDWIHLHLVGLDELEPLFEAIGREVLARTIATAPPEGGGGGATFEVDERRHDGAGRDGAGRRVEAWVVKA